MSEIYSIYKVPGGWIQELQSKYYDVDFAHAVSSQLLIALDNLATKSLRDDVSDPAYDIEIMGNFLVEQESILMGLLYQVSSVSKFLGIIRGLQIYTLLIFTIEDYSFSSPEHYNQIFQEFQKLIDGSVPFMSTFLDECLRKSVYEVVELYIELTNYHIELPNWYENETANWTSKEI